MELTCVLVLLMVGLTTASPYGYGIKGGAAAKADASAVASAYAGAGAVPLSIPSGADYSGSFSKSYSSSSASSSASSSSSSFSYSGSGAVGKAIPGSNGCGTGNCNSGAALGSQSSAAAGSQAYSGGNAGSLAGEHGGKTPIGSYGHKYGIGNSQANEAQDCGSEGCQSTKGSHAAGPSPQSISDAKAAASAAAEHLKSSGCEGSDCNTLPGSNIKCSSGQCDSNAKCSSGDCGGTSYTSSQEVDKKCTSGQCASNQGIEGSSSIGIGTDDIHVPLHGNSNSKLSYGATGSGCSNGNCGLSSSTGISKPATDLTAPKLEPTCFGPNCQNSPSCTGGNCNDGSYSPTKAPFTSTNSLNQISYSPSLPSSPGYGGLSKPGYSHGSSPSHSSTNHGCVPGTPGCSTGLTDNGPSDCVSGNCGPKSPAPGYGGLSSIKPSYSHGSSPSYAQSKPLEPACVSGNCGTFPSAPGYGAGSSIKPSYSQGISPSYSPLTPLEPACKPGTPGCVSVPSGNGPSDCVSGNCGPKSPTPGYSGLSSIKPSYSHGSSPSYAQSKPLEPGCVSGNCGTFPSAPGYGAGSSIKPSYSQGISPSYSPLTPLEPACKPGTPGCVSVPSGNDPSDCVSGNCGPKSPAPGYGGLSSIKPSYSHGSSPSYAQSKPLEPACLPGKPGCGAVPSGNGPSVCASGNCGSYPSAPGFDSISGIKPSYSHGTSPTYPQLKPSGPACAPGTPSCGSAISDSYHPGYGGSASNKPSYSHVSSPAYAFTAPSGLDCAPGTPGCGQVPSGNGPSSCASGNCGAIPSIPGYGTSSSINPGYSHGGSPSYSPVNPSGQACAPGSPGCAISPSASGPFGCTSRNCGGNTPSYPHGGSPLHSQVQPSGPACAPGTQGCGITSFPAGSVTSSCTSGNCGAHTSTSPHGCAPGAPGCSGTPSVILSPGYGTSGVGSTLNQANFGSHGTGSIQTSFIKPPTGYPTVPSGPGAVPGIGSPSYTGIVGATAGSSTQQGANKKATYTGGFGGPAGILKPNEFSAPSPTYGNKPAILSGSSSTKPSCTSGNCDQFSASGAQATPETLVGSSSPSGPSTGALPLEHGSSSNQANFGSHGTGSIQTSYIKPTTGFPNVPPSSDAVSGIGSPSYTSNFGATSVSSAQQGAKEQQHSYTGGFGGPNGILKPNEFSAASPTYGNKPAISTGSLAAKPSCTSGNCDQSSSGSAGQATAGASASSSAVAYTGGFDGPPGILKPYDNGKVDLKELPGKQLPGSSLGLHQGLAGSGIHSSYQNGGSQVGGSGIAQANAAAISATGVGGGNGGHSHGNDAAGGCGGGCGGSGSGSFGYSSSLGVSKAGVLDDPSSGLATAGAVAKSHSSSGARAYGGSYASSSASAHATSGASLKGGYGRR